MTVLLMLINKCIHLKKINDYNLQDLGFDFGRPKTAEHNSLSSEQDDFIVNHSRSERNGNDISAE